MLYIAVFLFAVLIVKGIPFLTPNIEFVLLARS